MNGNEKNAAGQDQPHRRRKRYSGTHPRSFDQKYKEHRGDGAVVGKLRAKGRTPAGSHVPVLFNEAMRWMNPSPGNIVCDCTLGLGGHSSEFLRRIQPDGMLMSLDVDTNYIEKAKLRLESVGGRFVVKLCNFAGIDKAMRDEQIDGFDIIFADLGVSSMQVDDPSRGISYKADGPLDMRMDMRLQKTGADVLAEISAADLSKFLWEYSDEPDHAKIAEWVVTQRQVNPITTTEQLTRLVLNAKGFSPRARGIPPWQKPGGLHPAARTFQALRIIVNDELGCLRELLRKAPACLRPGGRIGIISFHSGEDRMVKHAFRDGLASGVFAQISDDVIRPGQAEVRGNPRSASAKFRWAIKA